MEYTVERNTREKYDGGDIVVEYRIESHRSEFVTDPDADKLNRRITSNAGRNVLCTCNGTLQAVSQCLATTVALGKIVDTRTDTDAVAVCEYASFDCAKSGMKRLVDLMRRPSEEQSPIEGEGRTLDELLCGGTQVGSEKRPNRHLKPV